MKPETQTPPGLSKEIQNRLGEKLRTTYEHVLSHFPPRIKILSQQVSETQKEIPSIDVSREMPKVPEENILDPETTTMLQSALDEGWAVVHRTGDTNITREDLAKRLVALSWTGERSPSKLLIQAFRTLLRKPPAKDSEGDS